MAITLTRCAGGNHVTLDDGRENPPVVLYADLLSGTAAGADPLVAQVQTAITQAGAQDFAAMQLAVAGL